VGGGIWLPTIHARGGGACRGGDRFDGRRWGQPRRRWVVGGGGCGAGQSRPVSRATREHRLGRHVAGRSPDHPVHTPHLCADVCGDVGAATTGCSFLRVSDDFGGMSTFSGGVGGGVGGGGGWLRGRPDRKRGGETTAGDSAGYERRRARSGVAVVIWAETAARCLRGFHVSRTLRPGPRAEAWRMVG